MEAVAGNLEAARRSVEAACGRAGRDPSEVVLLAVSKTFPAEAVRAAWEAGQRDFGESRQREGAAKVAALPEGIRWHFIGKLQRNKARKVVEDFAVIHSVDSMRLAATLNRVAGEAGRRPEVFLEINLAGEERKGGFAPRDLLEQVETLSGLSSLSLRGLMAIPPAVDDPEEARPWFARLRELRDQLEGERGVRLPELSMGMSGDFEVAIEEGSTVVRIGSAIFGERPPAT